MIQRYSTSFFIEKILSSRRQVIKKKGRKYYLVDNNPYLVHENQDGEQRVTGQRIQTWLDVYNEPEPSRLDLSL